MSTTQEYKDSGYQDLWELVESICIGSHTGESFVRNRLAGPMSRFRLLFIHQGLIVLPEDRKKQGVYDIQLQYFFAAYLEWHKPFVRKSAFEVDEFFHAYFAGEGWAVGYIPPSMRKGYRKLTVKSPRSVGAMALRLVTA